jgi:ABC-2 type transport system ATP-binding protein
LSPYLGPQRAPLGLDVGGGQVGAFLVGRGSSRVAFSDSGTLSCHSFRADRLIGLSELGRAVGPAWRSGQNAHVAKRTTILKVSGLRRAFGPNTIFDRFSLEVRTGEAIALTGRNGAGKSTLLRCLVGADRPDDGTVEVCGNPMRETSPEIRRDVATVIDDLDFFPDLSVVEHLDLLARAHGISEPDAMVDEVLDEVQLVPQSGQLPGTLSSGQRRRLALATAFVRPRRLLILDEPEQRLDTEGVSWLAGRLKSERQSGLAIVFASHEPALVESVATRVVELGAPRG